MLGLTIADLIALLFFALSWAVYHFRIDGSKARSGLSAQMNQQRIGWMREMSKRDVRLVDTAIMASLQNGTAFFASTSLIALGGAATLMRATDDVLKVFSDVPLGLVTTRGLWELKIIGLGIIFGYAFFKFAWSYRLFNYSAILLGATPAAHSEDADERETAMLRAAYMNIAAARQFTRGQRALFFSFAYLGWFVSPYLFFLTTALIVWVIWTRQFRSDALAAVELQMSGHDLTGGEA
jgi:uncharacterized membrane protein